MIRAARGMRADRPRRRRLPVGAQAGRGRRRQARGRRRQRGRRRAALVQGPRAADAGAASGARRAAAGRRGHRRRPRLTRTCPRISRAPITSALVERRGLDRIAVAVVAAPDAFISGEESAVGLKAFGRSGAAARQGADGRDGRSARPPDARAQRRDARASRARRPPRTRLVSRGRHRGRARHVPVDDQRRRRPSRGVRVRLRRSRSATCWPRPAVRPRRCRPF